MADGPVAPSTGKPKEHPRKGVSLAVLLLVGLLGVLIGVFLRPTVDEQLSSGKETQASGKALLEEVNAAILDMEDRQLKEVVRLFTTGGPQVVTTNGGVPVTQMAEYRRIHDALKSLHAMRDALKVAEYGGFRKERLDALTPVVRDRLESIKVPPPTK